MTEVPVEALWDGGGPQQRSARPESVFSFNGAVSEMDTHGCPQTHKKTHASVLFRVHATLPPPSARQIKACWSVSSTECESKYKQTKAQVHLAPD